MNNEELVKELKQIDKDFNKARKKYQNMMAEENSVELLIKINSQINKTIQADNFKTYDYSKAKKRKISKGDKNGN